MVANEEETSPHREEREIKDIIPAEWRDEQVWISSYRVFCVSQELFSRVIEFELLGARGHFFWGGAPFWRSSQQIVPQPDGSVVVHIQTDGLKHADDGPYLMLLTPTHYGNTPSAEEETRSKLRAVLALLRLTLGRNVAVDHLGDLILRPSVNEVTAMGHGFRVPGWDGPPDLSDNALDFVRELEHAVEGLSSRDRHRIELSLQWFFSAHETYGVNGFLMYWFALEALAMPGTAKISAVEDKLAAIYGITREGRTRAVQDRKTLRASWRHSAPGLTTDCAYPRFGVPGGNLLGSSLAESFFSAQERRRSCS
jgi:hypothetical protein